MICALFRTRCRDLPTDRIELYRACRTMFYRRDSERKIDLAGDPALNDDKKNRLLGGLAYWMVRNVTTRVEEEVADRRFEDRLANMEMKTSGGDVRRLFAERIGLLRRPVPGWIDFPHKTFQELYAAEEALDQQDIRALVDNAEKEAWREVVILAAGLARPHEAKDLIEGLLARGEGEREKTRYFYLLAAPCLPGHPEVEPEKNSNGFTFVFGWFDRASFEFHKGSGSGPAGRTDSVDLA
jgi:predicted NACHT family NTPase